MLGVGLAVSWDGSDVEGGLVWGFSQITGESSIQLRKKLDCLIFCHSWMTELPLAWMFVLGLERVGTGYWRTC